MSMEKNYTAIGDHLREERVRLGLSQDELGEIGGVTRRTVTAWERGDQFPNAAFLSLAASKGMDVSYVLTGIRSVPLESGLTPEEVALLGNYRSADADGQAAARAVLFAVTKPQKKAAAGGE